MSRRSKWFRAHYQCPDPNMSGSYRGGYPSWNDSENSIFYQAQEKDDKTQYEPSKSLRSLIVERLQAQQKMLIRLNTQIGTLIIAAGEGEANSAAGNKGPGDTQISAQQVKMLRPTRENIAESIKAMRAPSRGGRTPYGGPDYDALAAQVAQDPTMRNDGRLKDPFARYQQLQQEITGLLAMAPQSAWTQEAMSERKAYNKGMKSLLGAAKSGEEEDDDDDAVSTSGWSGFRSCDGDRCARRRHRLIRSSEGCLTRPSRAPWQKPQLQLHLFSNLQHRLLSLQCSCRLLALSRCSSLAASCTCSPWVHRRIMEGLRVLRWDTGLRSTRTISK